MKSSSDLLASIAEVAITFPLACLSARRLISHSAFLCVDGCVRPDSTRTDLHSLRRLRGGNDGLMEGGNDETVPPGRIALDPEALFSNVDRMFSNYVIGTESRHCVNGAAFAFAAFCCSSADGCVAGKL